MQPSPWSISRNFLSSQIETLYPLNNHSLFSPPPSPWQPPFYFLSLWIWLGTSCQWNHTVFVFLWLVYFTQHVLKIHSCCNILEFYSFLRLNYIYIYIYIILLNIFILLPMWNFCDFQWATCHCGNVRKYKPFLAFLSKVSHSFSAHDFAKAIFMLNYNFIHIHTPTHMRACTHTHTHTYIYIYTHTHTPYCVAHRILAPHQGLNPYLLQWKHGVLTTGLSGNSQSWIIFHWMNILPFVYPLISWWTFGLFPNFGYFK